LKNKILNKNILVIGDSIIDKDFHVENAGKSLETDSIKTKFIKQTIDLGGASRTVNFLSNFDINIEFFTNLQADYFTEFNDIYSKLKIHQTETVSTVEKLRIKMKKGNQLTTVFQINKDFKSLHESYSDIFNILNKNYDIVLINDYRTGMFDKKLIKIVNELDYKKIVFASQLSSNNLNICNYSNFHILILNKYEFESEFNIQFDLNHNYSSIFTNKMEKVIVTLGDEGAVLITKEENTYFSTKSKKFNNTIGAGDVFVGSYLLYEDINLANLHTLNFLEELNEKL
jgi:bifunctional ADP-heptose synthase (sugar kinase/adenylyltransferase)